MSVNVLENIESYFTPDIISKASSLLGESPTSTSKAMTGVIASLLERVANLASTPGGAGQLENLVNKAGADGSIVNNVEGVFSGGNTTTSVMGVGRELLGTLLGGNTGSMASAVSNFSGISSNSARSLLSLAAPLVLGALAKLKYAQTMTTGALANLLSGQRANIAAAVPSSLATAAPGADVQGLRPVSDPVAVTRGAETRRWRGLAALLLIPLLALILYFSRRSPENAPVTPAVAAVPVTLCNGQSLPLQRDSFNYNLGTFLARGNNADLPKTFVFDNLNFDSGTTALTPESRATVLNLITILKACPSAQVQLVGHTDNTGDAGANLTLSQNRANVVRGMLVNGGVASERITTAGYGQERPVAPNDTEEGKARNRRTELVVLQK